MKIPEEQKAEIIEGMVAMLDPEATETIEEIRKIPGRDLINLHEIYKTHDGHRVLPGIEYAVSCTETRKVNHRQKIGHIIADAANRDEMMANLGQHLAKYALDRQAVISSIPVNLSINNISKSEN